MCNPLPGPRCSGYARQRLDKARKNRLETQASFTQAQQSLTVLYEDVAKTTHRPAQSDTYAHSPEMAEYHEARDAQTRAETEHSAALSEYETTPDGQKSLAVAVERLEARGETSDAQQMRGRLTEAKRIREQQVVDLKTAQEQDQRLHDAQGSGPHGAMLMNAQLRERQAQDQLDAAQADLVSVTAEFDPKESDAILGETVRLRDTVASTEPALKKAGFKIQMEAKRLYMEAGVSERMAGYYSRDIVDNAAAAKADAGTRFPEKETFPSKALRWKVKPGGPDKELTAAAGKAAQDDPEYQVAKDEYDAARMARQEQVLVQQTFRKEKADPAFEQRALAARNLAKANMRVEDAQRDFGKARGDNRRLHAQVAAGASLDATSVSWEDAAGQITRNPDGTINAWVYKEQEGFPNGRYVRATGTEFIPGQTPSSALVLEDGTLGFKSTHYGGGYIGARQTTQTSSGVLVGGGHPAASSLRDEGIYGFHSIIDSTD